MSIDRNFGLNPEFKIKTPSSLENSTSEKTGLIALDVANKSYKIIESYKKDSLTDCYNRNFYESWKKENDNPEKNSNKIALIFFDLNNLKKVNDTQGHDAGDDLIRRNAEMLKRGCRQEDLIFRYGGDEFIIAFFNKDNDLNFEEKINSSIKKQMDSSKNTDFSFGVAVFDKNIDKSLNDTQKRADDRMYEYKKGIKNAEKIAAAQKTIQRLSSNISVNE